MIIAEIHKKLSSRILIDVERKEDLLTSSFWGTVRYIDPNLLLRPLLKRSVNKCLNNLQLSEITSEVTYSFWTYMTNSEPDLLIEFNIQGKTFAIIVEVKLDSGLSSDDQLKREWMDLSAIKAENKYLIYLTKDRVFPKEIFENEKYLRQEEFYLNHTFWLSWFEINDALGQIIPTNIYEKTIIEDLRSILLLREIRTFSGWSLDWNNEEFSLDFIPFYNGSDFFANYEVFTEIFSNFYRG